MQTFYLVDIRDKPEDKGYKDWGEKRFFSSKETFASYRFSYSLLSFILIYALPKILLHIQRFC
jgi:hypothetical protein